MVWVSIPHMGTQDPLPLSKLLVCLLLAIPYAPVASTSLLLYYHPCITQGVHVGIWYILRAQRGSHIPTLRPKYIPYTYMDPLHQQGTAADDKGSEAAKKRKVT